MTQTHEKIIKILSWVLVALLAVILILQFVPFWTVDGEGLSIATYIWFPIDHENATIQIKNAIGEDYHILSIVASHVAILILGIVGIIFGLWKPHTSVPGLCGLVAGGLGCYGYFFKPAYQLGSNWQLHGALCAVILVVAVAALVIKGVDYYRTRPRKAKVVRN